MRGGGGGKIGGIGLRDEFSYTMGLRALMDHEGCVILRPPWGPAPCAKAYNNQQTYYAKVLHC
jgi:hypothetical protein